MKLTRILERCRPTAHGRRIDVRPSRHSGRPGAFTLIELLVVMSIIALLAALITWGVSIGYEKRLRSRVVGELEGLKLAIDGFHKKHGFYPAGNSDAANTGTNQLFYELTGTEYDKASSTFKDFLGTTLTSGEIRGVFGVDGFVNSGATNSARAATDLQNFLPGLKPTAYAEIPGSKFRLLVVPTKGPGGQFNPWHYDSSTPEHNPESYDLWAEVIIGKKTVVIGNWND